MYSLIVVGGGPAGIATAIAARRRGLRTMLVERYGFLGGMATAGLVMPFMRTLGVGGLYTEFLEKLEVWNALEGRKFDCELAKLVLDEWLTEEKVDLLFHSLLIGVKVDNKKLKSITVAGKGQELELTAPYFVDCTGDGDLAALSGVTTNMGREEDHICQPMTTSFQVGGVYDNLMPSRQELNALYNQAKSEGRLKNPREDVLCWQTIRPNEIHFNSTRVTGKNPISIQELTEAELEARRQIVELYNLLKQEVPAFKDSYLLRIATQIGVRESRTIEGAYRLTEEDVLTGRKFSDGIGKCSYPIDIHSLDGEGTRISNLAPGNWYEIPYRTLYSKEIENLLVAGRCISSTHEAQASLRIMPTCMVIGQAAGTAIALAEGQNLTVDRVTVEELQTELKAAGADLD